MMKWYTVALTALIHLHRLSSVSGKLPINFLNVAYTVTSWSYHIRCVGFLTWNSSSILPTMLYNILFKIPIFQQREQGEQKIQTITMVDIIQLCFRYTWVRMHILHNAFELFNERLISRVVSMIYWSAVGSDWHCWFIHSNSHLQCSSCTTFQVIPKLLFPVLQVPGETIYNSLLIIYVWIDKMMQSSWNNSGSS